MCGARPFAVRVGRRTRPVPGVTHVSGWWEDSQVLNGRYDDAPLDAGEALLARPGFWSNHLSAVCAGGAGDVRPVPEWFGEDTADADALSEILFDPARWPVFRLPGADGSEVVVVFRNLVGDHGTDFLLVPPGLSRAQQIATGQGSSRRAG